ncbi:MAG: RNase P subunit p30 family protein [Promethearchaeota archaeon]
MSYFESRLRINLENSNEIKKKLGFCERLGIKNLILEPKNDIRRISLNLKKKIENLTKINLSYRITLKPNSLNELKRVIKEYSNFEDLLSVETPDKEAQLYAARDSRVDLISFSEQNILKTITPGVISLAKQNESFIEFSLAPIMVTNRSIQSKNFRNLYRFIRLVRNLNVNYIINGNFEDLYDFRHPRALISICNSLLGIPLNAAKRVFKENPLKLLERVQKKRDKNIIEAGVRLVKELE